MKFVSLIIAIINLIAFINSGNQYYIITINMWVALSFIISAIQDKK